MEGTTYVRSLVPEVLAGNIDPMTGMATEPVGPKLVFLKMAAAGAAVFSEFIFAKWRQYKTQSQKERQQHDNNPTMLALQCVAIETLAIRNSPGSTPDSQHYDWEALDAREQQQRSLPQLLAECRELRQQLREQKQVFEKRFEEEKVKFDNHLQRMQLGMDNRGEEMKNLQNTVKEQQQLLLALEGSVEDNNKGKSSKDPMWEQSLVGMEPWQLGRREMEQRGEAVPLETQNFAIGATTDIMEAIDKYVDDYKEHGGTIADRNCISGQIVADWGVRVRRRLEERGIQVKGSGATTTTTNTIHNKASGVQNGITNKDYQTPVHRVRRILRSPDPDSSPE